jgi:hypothetical protein
MPGYMKAVLPVLHDHDQPTKEKDPVKSCKLNTFFLSFFLSKYYAKVLIFKNQFIYSWEDVLKANNKFNFCKLLSEGKRNSSVVV